MSDYYIRTPEQDESRGPFDATKLRTLAEAGQVSENTLYYDEENEEWTPIALNEALMAEIFPKTESLKLKIGIGSDDPEQDPEGESGINVEDLLKAADADTKETQHLRRSQKSFEKAVSLAPTSLGIMMILSAISFIFPHLEIIQSSINEEGYTSLLNYPFLIVGAFDLLMAIFLFLSVTEIFPLIRGRSMLGLGFGVYLGWALGDPMLMLAFGLGSFGAFVATLSKQFSLMLLAIILGVGGHGFLAYMAMNQRFAEFYSTIQLGLFAQ